METELEKLEKQRKDLFNELDLLREFETESMIDYNEPIDCKADQELSLVPRGACKYCTLHCDQCSLRCNRFLQYYNIMIGISLSFLIICSRLIPSMNRRLRNRLFL